MHGSVSNNMNFSHFVASEKSMAEDQSKYDILYTVHCIISKSDFNRFCKRRRSLFYVNLGVLFKENNKLY